MDVMGIKSTLLLSRNMFPFVFLTCLGGSTGKQGRGFELDVYIYGE